MFIFVNFTTINIKFEIDLSKAHDIVFTDENNIENVIFLEQLLNL